jgi:hypothetical protein
VAFAVAAAVVAGGFIEWNRHYLSTVEAREMCRGFELERGRLNQYREMRRETVAALSLQRISLQEAASRLQELDACTPMIQADIRMRYPGRSLAESEARCAVALACQFCQTPEARRELAVRLSHEFSCLFQGAQLNSHSLE